LKLLALGALLVLVELAFRRLAPRSRAYARWTAGVEAVGRVWTAVILALVYFLSVGPTRAVLTAFGRDLLDRGLAPEPTFWRPYEANPLGPETASRHQF
jgi:hypothetical protein